MGGGTHIRFRNATNTYKQVQNSFVPSHFTNGKFLSDIEFRRFWISWKNFNLSLGLEHTVGQDVIWTTNIQTTLTFDLKYIMFGSSQVDGLPSDWIYYDGKYFR